MKAALIPPISLLKPFGPSDGDQFHLLLSHLLTSPNYRAFYRRQRKNGAFLTLDNSAHEYGAGDSPDMLATYAHQMKVDEVVVPDVLFDAEGTVKKAIETHESWFEDGGESMRDFRLMYVPQGRTRAEWAVCLQELI